MKILSNKQYEAIIDICREADQEIAALKGQVDDLLKTIKTKDDIIDEQAQQIYSLQEDLASLKWNLNKCDPQLIDFPNSTNYQLADFETDFPGENPEDII